MRRIIISAIIILLSAKAFTQETMSFRYADSLTYDLYLKKNWNELIGKAKDAIISGHDYYYMRMRLGIACYERHNYALAEKHFIRALRFNEGDQTALGYLFYTYYYSGRYFQAWTIISEMKSSERAMILKESGIKRNSVTVESYFLNAETEDITSAPDQNFTNNEGGSQVVTKSFINNAVYLSHLTGKNSSYYHSYTNLIKHNHLHYYDGMLNSTDLEEQKVVQNQYYGRFNFFTRSGWAFSPSFHLLTAGYPLVAFYYTGTNPSTYTYDGRSNGFAGGFGITKTGGYISLSGEAVYSKLNKTEQLQGTMSVILYPAGNRNIYLGGNFTALYNPDTDSPEIRPVSGFIAGFAIAGRVWFEFSGTSGNMKNYTESNGLVIFNGIDYPTGKYSGKIILPFYKAGITLFAGAGIGSYSSEYMPFDGYNDFDPNKLNYNNFSVTGGLSWKF